MAKQARQVIVLTESEKFAKPGIVPLLPPHNVSVLVTDSAIPSDARHFLEKAGVRIINPQDS
jgi:DeoR/GlpR family transcriptional regulator of sugar metabolism